MKASIQRILVTWALTVLMGCCWMEAGIVHASAAEFEIKSVSASESSSAAGAHPDFTATIAFRHGPSASGRVQQVTVSLPPGLVGNPHAVLQCDTGHLVAFGNCPVGSQVGLIKPHLEGLGPVYLPLFNLEPVHPDREIARLGFFVRNFPVFIDISVRTGSDYGVNATVDDAGAQLGLLSAETTIWGVPGASIHDGHRVTQLEAQRCIDGTTCETPGGRPSGLASVKPFLDNPSACEAQEVGFAAVSYQYPDLIARAQATLPTIGGCEALRFEPSLNVTPTSHVAGSPTGLHAVLKMPQNEDPNQLATSRLRDATVTLPAGLGISASAAAGLSACSAEQAHIGAEVPAECPSSAKLGAITVASPPLPGLLHGSIYQRTPTAGNQFQIWLIADQYGLHLKIPGEIEPNPITGQITVQFQELPQLPVEEIALDLWGGDLAPLKNPDACGAYSTSFSFSPWSETPPIQGESQMTIDEGCGVRGFSPRLEAGVTNPVAGAFSPFVSNIDRENNEENLARLELHLPKGLLAKIAGVPLCPEAATESGACPADSKIGSLTVAVGAGTRPLWLPQPGKVDPSVHLAGPYEGAPFSVVTEVPAQAGPFDLGTVVVRAGLYVDPETGQASVRSDLLPQYIEGVPALYRSLRIFVDRPHFTVNPTNCAALAVMSRFTSPTGVIATPSSGFQVSGCKALRFSPHLILILHGGTKRGDYPALAAQLKAKKGQANVSRVAVALPHSEFLAQEHIGTICTRVQFASAKCPRSSIYGQARAWTPLLRRPLQGPVYLRSSEHLLPDLVVALHGDLDIDLVGRIDSANGGIRTTFESVPDAPITKFVLRMKGGKKSLLTNSRDLCRSANFATVHMRAQNGRGQNSKLRLRTSSCRRHPSH